MRLLESSPSAVHEAPAEHGARRRITAPSATKGARLAIGSIGVIGSLAAIGFGMASSFNEFLGVDILEPHTVSEAVVLGGRFVIGALRDVFSCFTENPRLSLAVFIAGIVMAFAVHQVQRRLIARESGRILVVIAMRCVLIAAGILLLYQTQLPYLEVSSVLTKEQSRRFDVAGSPAYFHKARLAYERGICMRLPMSRYRRTVNTSIDCWKDSTRKDLAIMRQARTEFRADFVISLVVSLALLAIAVTLPSKRLAGGVAAILEQASAFLLFITALLSAVVTPLTYARTRYSTDFPTGHLIVSAAGKVDTIAGSILASNDHVVTIHQSSGIVVLPIGNVIRMSIDSLADPVRAVISDGLIGDAPADRVPAGSLPRPHQ